LEIGSNCDLTYRNSKNQRLHVELSLIRLCRLMDDLAEKSENKKGDQKHLQDRQEDLPLPSKSEILRNENQYTDNKTIRQDLSGSNHDPVIEKPSKSFSIKEIISEDNGTIKKPGETKDPPDNEFELRPKDEFNHIAFEVAWKEFTDQLKGDGTRIVSMFKSLKPELENDLTIKIHLSNATQKDIFLQNYKQRLINFLENKFTISGIDVDTIIDLAETNEILYTDEQKHDYLFTKFPILKEMKRTFNLDIT
jgi:DNA polymerase-3 subunit gamma/tau